MDIPVLATEQNPKGLGATVPELTSALLSLPAHLNLGLFSKSLFSMITPEVETAIQQRDTPVRNIVLFGIEVRLISFSSTEL